MKNEDIAHSSIAQSQRRNKSEKWAKKQRGNAARRTRPAYLADNRGSFLPWRARGDKMVKRRKNQNRRFSIASLEESPNFMNTTSSDSPATLPAPAPVNWRQLAEDMARRPQPAPDKSRALADREKAEERGEKKSGMEFHLDSESIGSIAAMGMTPAIAATLPAPWFPAMVAGAVLSRASVSAVAVAARSARQIRAERPSWSKAGRLIKANFQREAQALRAESLILGAMANLAVAAALFGAGKALRLKIAKKAGAVFYGRAEAIGERTQAARDRVVLIEKELAADCGPATTWRAARDALWHDRDPVRAAALFERAPFDPRWSMGKLGATFDQALARQLDEKSNSVDPLNPEKHEAVSRTIALASSLREAIELNLILKASAPDRNTDSAMENAASTPLANELDAAAHIADQAAPRKRTSRL